MHFIGNAFKRVTNACVENGNKVHFDSSDSFWITILSNKNNDVVDERLNKIIDLIKGNRGISASQIAKVLNISSRTAQRDIVKLKKQNKIQRVGPEKTGHWQVLK